jgi:hypothetical protein
MIAALYLLFGVLDPASYGQRLEALDAQLARGDRKGAATAARGLLEEKLGGGLAPDAWVLEPIAQRAPHRARLQRLLQTLASPPGAEPAVDRSVLELVRRKQAMQGGAPGGDLGDIPIDEPSFIRAIVEALATAAGWVLSGIRTFFDWLLSLFPDLRTATDASAGRILAAVFVCVGLIVVVVVAFAVRVGLRRGRTLAAAESAPISSRREEDPLSRTAMGWEQRARALAAEGRWREAIRAWYHALLVHSTGAGLLQYRRGKTNWEYVHMLPPSLRWRPVFEELTRLFEREWYGRAESTPEVLQTFESGAARILTELRSRA